MMITDYIRKKTAQLNAYAMELAAKDIYATNMIAVARSILAAGTLITLLFSPYESIFVDSMNKLAFVDTINSLNLFYLIQSPVLAVIVSCLILCAVIIGYFPQVTGILHWWVCFSLFNRGVLVDGGDQISMILSMFLLPITVLDPRLNHWVTGRQHERPFTNIFVNLVMKLVAVQMAVIYFHAAVEKLKVPEWINGTAVYYFLNHNLFGPVPAVRGILMKLMANQYIALLSDWGVLLLEILLFAALFMNRAGKRRMFIAGILFHFTIIVFHGLFSFFFAMTAGLVLYLYPADKNFSLRIRRSNTPSVSPGYHYPERGPLRAGKPEPFVR